MLGAGASAIVVVGIAALVVGIDIAQPRVRGVVVVTTAAGETLKSACKGLSKSRHVPFVAILPVINGIDPAAYQFADFFC